MFVRKGGLARWRQGDRDVEIWPQQQNRTPNSLNIVCIWRFIPLLPSNFDVVVVLPLACKSLFKCSTPHLEAITLAGRWRCSAQTLLRSVWLRPGDMDAAPRSFVLMLHRVRWSRKHGRPLYIADHYILKIISWIILTAYSVDGSTSSRGRVVNISAN